MRKNSVPAAAQAEQCGSTTEQQQRGTGFGDDGDAVGEDHGVVLETGVVTQRGAVRLGERAGLGLEVVVVADEEEVIVRVAVIGGDEGHGFPLLGEGVDVAVAAKEVQTELPDFGVAEVDLAEHVQRFSPRYWRHRSDQRVAGWRKVRASGIVETVDIGARGEIGEEDGFEDRTGGDIRTATVAVAGEDEDFAVIEGHDAALGTGAIDAAIEVAVDPGKLEDILLDRVGGDFRTAGNVIGEDAGIGAALAAGAAGLVAK